MRTLSSGIAAALTAQGSFLGFLAEITATTAQVIRVCSMDVDFAFGGNTFNAANLTVAGMAWDGGVSRPAQLTLGDGDLGYWALTLNLALVDAPVRIWQVYNNAPGEAQPYWSGRIGAATRQGMSVQFALANDSASSHSPRTRVQQLANPVYLLPPGQGIEIAGVRWIIQRAKQ